MSSPLAKPLLTLDLRGVSAEDREVVASILTDLAGAADKIRRAGERWVRLDEAVRDKVMTSVPGHYRPFLERLQRVGDGSLHPQLYSASGRGVTRLEKLPMEEQHRYLTELIPVAVGKDGGDTKRVDVAAMDGAMQRQVFERVEGNRWRVRTVQEQRAWLRDDKAKQAAKKLTEAHMTKITRVGRYVLEKGRIFPDASKVKEGFTRADVVQMLKDLQA